MTDDAVVPEDLSAALAGHEVARRAFEGLPPSHRQQYLQWIDEAKKDDTRVRRIAKALAMLSEHSR